MSQTVHVITESTSHQEPTVRIHHLCILYALAGALAVFAWQALTVHFNYAGNWTALFCTGDAFPPPPELAPGTYIFPKSHGFDGQFYRYIAHDPWLQRRWAPYFDAPALRYSRILMPALAWLLAFGRDHYVDAAYIALNLLFTGLGIYWTARWAAWKGRSPLWGFGFLALPATLIAADRLTLDAALIALCAGVSWYTARGSTARLYVLLVAAPLLRDTGLILVGACCMFALTKRLWGRAALFATAAAPAFAWLAFVWSRLPAPTHGAKLHWLFHQPVVGPIIELFQPHHYPFPPAINAIAQAGDALALCSFIALLGFSVWLLREWPLSPERWTLLAFLVLTVAFSTPSYWENVYNYARPLCPIVLITSLHAVTNRRPWVLVAVLLIDVRIATQWGPQIAGVVRGVL